MKEIFKKSTGLFGKTVIINVLCLIVVVSFVSLSVAVFAEVTGHVAYGQKGEEGEVEQLYVHYLKDGADTKLKTYEEQGYTVTKKEIKEVSKSGHNITLIVAQLFCFGILMSFTYPNLWDKGYKDRNMVLTGNVAADPLKGLKIGLISQIPALALIVVFAVIGNSSTVLYKVMNGAFYSLIEFTVSGAATFGDLAVWKLFCFAAMIMIIPLITFIGYYLGYKDFSIGEKFIYKNKKKRI